MTNYSMILDLVLAALLLIAILYCWRLDGKLKNLRSGKDGMIEAARELQSSVEQAERAIAGLRQSADAAGRDLQMKIEEARAHASAVQAPAPSHDAGLRRRTAI
ncbi:MAG: DUF6468 domain-containing protein [Hyphomonadaceae bacterium]